MCGKRVVMASDSKRSASNAPFTVFVTMSLWFFPDGNFAGVQMFWLTRLTINEI
jgi:hypothetical protein